MHLRNTLVLDRVRLTSLAAVGDGTHIEIAPPDRADPLLTFREDERLGLQAVIHLPDKDVVFPLADLKRAIAAAEREVHTESFYDQPTPDA